MIHYQLRCGAAHEFDGWFPGSAAFEAQAAAGLLECPRCGERRVERALMAPALPRAGRPTPAASQGDTSATDVDSAAGNAAARGKAAGTSPPPGAATRPALPGRPLPAPAALPDQVRAMLHRLRHEVERRCDYVGGEFAAEARRIHDGESPARGIYGEASPEQAEALAEDGIEVSRIPWLPRADA